MKVRMFFATGYEEVEALTVVDLLRRAGADCLMVSAEDSDSVTGAHGISVAMDEKISEIADDADMLVLPGGIPGVPNLMANSQVKDKIVNQYEKGKLVAAICAAPTALGAFGILKDKKATCYPGMESQLQSKDISSDSVVTDGNVITSRGLGTAIPFGLKLVEILFDKNTAEELAEKIVYKA
jgi:4-methyl-5(b-hydroxyethyl)-thiazole monophosphate biosynthesis